MKFEIWNLKFESQSYDFDLTSIQGSTTSIVSPDIDTHIIASTIAAAVCLSRSKLYYSSFRSHSVGHFVAWPWNKLEPVALMDRYMDSVARHDWEWGWFCKNSVVGCAVKIYDCSQCYINK